MSTHKADFHLKYTQMFMHRYNKPPQVHVQIDRLGQDQDEILSYY